MKDIEISLGSTEIHPGDEICGTVIVNYAGKYDGVVVNTQILDSNEMITYHSYNGQEISQKTARLFVGRDLMPEGRMEFTASTLCDSEHDIKFRASIIEQHKEIENDVIFGRLSAR